MQPSTNPSPKKSFHSFTEKIKIKICQSIRAVNWQSELDVDDVNEAFSRFHSKLIDSVEKFAPTKTKTINPTKQPRAKWLTAGIVNSINKNKELYKKSIQTSATLESKNKYTILP